MRVGLLTVRESDSAQLTPIVFAFAADGVTFGGALCAQAAIKPNTIGTSNRRDIRHLDDQVNLNATENRRFSRDLL